MGEATQAPAEAEAPAEDTSEAANGAPLTEASAANEAPPRVRMKVGDEEIDPVETLQRMIDALGPDAVKRVDGISKTARQKLNELGTKEAQLRAAFEDMKDPDRVFDVIEAIHGAKTRELMERRYARYLEDDSLKPEEREKRSVTSDLERLKAEKAKLEAEKRERERVQMVQQLTPQFGRDFKRALEAAGSEAEPEMLAAMAQYVEQELEYIRSDDDYRAVIGEAARAVARRFGEDVVTRLPKMPRERIKPALVEVLKNTPAAELKELLGAEKVRELQKLIIDSVKAAQPANSAPKPAARPTNGQPERPRMTLDEFFAQRERERG